MVNPEGMAVAQHQDRYLTIIPDNDLDARLLAVLACDPLTARGCAGHAFVTLRLLTELIEIDENLCLTELTPRNGRWRSSGGSRFGNKPE